MNDRATDVLVLATFAALPLNAVRLGPMTVADAFLALVVVVWLGRAAAARTLVVRAGADVALAASLALLTSGTISHLLLRSVGGYAGPAVEVVFAGLATAALASIVDRALFARGTIVFGLAAMASGLLGLANPNAAEGRIQGLATHPNHLALTLLVAVVVLGARGVSAARAQGPRASAVLLVSAAGVAGLLLVRTGSRSGVLALVIGSGIALVLRVVRSGSASARLSRVLLPLGASLAVVQAARSLASVAAEQSLASVLPQGSALDRLLTGAGSAARSDQLRRSLLRESVDRWLERPWTGWGFERLESAHSVPLQVLEAVGVVGVTLLLGVVMLYTLHARRRQIVADHRVILAVAVGAFLLAQNAVTDRYLWVVLMAPLLLPSSGEDELATASASERLAEPARSPVRAPHRCPEHSPTSMASATSIRQAAPGGSA